MVISTIKAKLNTFVEDITNIIPAKFSSNWQNSFRGDYKNVV